MDQKQEANLVSDPADSDISPQEFLNRELSWLEFNRRVLHEAEDPRTPLLERVRFLGIFTSNLDEFFMKRVGGLKRQAATPPRTPDGLAPDRALAEIRKTVIALTQAQAACYEMQVKPALTQNGVRLLTWPELAAAEREEAQRYFRSSVFPILTPLAVDPGHPFPFISNLSESLGVVLRYPDRDDDLFARIKIPEGLPRWIRLPGEAGGDVRFYSLYDLILHHLQDLFPSMIIRDVMLFRVTRNAEMELDEEDADDIREAIEEELRQRRFANAVRLEHGPNPNPWILGFLMEELELTPEDVYEFTGELESQDLCLIADLNLPRLRFEPWVPMTPPSLVAEEDADIFALIRNGDLLVHHPYDSFNASVERFIKAAADDPKVLAIKMTLYRTGDESPFIRTLIRAAEARKQVVCMVELKARFDEERNIQLAHELEKAGVHVVYGMVGLKTHTKTALVVRQDPDGIRCYAHIGTGNYNSQTARLYTDLGLFTCDGELTGELVEMFHYLTGRSLKRDYTHLLVAPVNMRERFHGMIRREIEHAQAGRPARIIAKMNSLEERKTIRLLYEASRAGVQVDLIVRGFCCLRPGVAEMSNNIRVISVIGRFLEHSRIFYFRNGAADETGGEFYIGSADWMYRNLLARVEVCVPIRVRPLRERLWEILQIMLADRRQAWDMHPDGSYTQRTPASESDIGTQAFLMQLTRQRYGSHTP